VSCQSEVRRPVVAVAPLRISVPSIVTARTPNRSTRRPTTGMKAP
jgi:hypothetical protein